jgi:hypothetical protein
VIVGLVSFAAFGLGACGGVEPAGKLPPLPEPEPAIAPAGAVTTVADAGGNARYLGEVKNSGDVVACYINLSINSFDAGGNLLSNPGNKEFNFGDLLGETFRFSAFATKTQDNCISPGDTGSFDIRTDVPIAKVASHAVDIPCGHKDLYPGCLAAKDQPFVPPSAPLVLDGAISESVGTDGHMVYSGTIRNMSVAFVVAYHVKIVITARDAQGLVADVACATMDGPTCPLAADAVTSGESLSSQETWSFTVPLSIPPSATCPGCFSFHINQKMAP